jgi:cyclomaltodextrinase / maltogenic alpha-amylase / neopullulanase
MNSIYKHFKGNHYEVLYTAKHSETLEEYIVYKALYGEEKIWVRPKEMFFENVVFNGESVPRFQLVNPN